MWILIIFESNLNGDGQIELIIIRDQPRDLRRLFSSASKVNSISDIFIR